jgi:hypothetical protein
MNVVSSKNIYEVLEMIRKKPELCLTSRTISSLQNFLNGYLMIMPYDIERKDGYPPFDEFKLWVLHQKKGFIGVGNPYSSFFLSESGGEEEKAFNQFFQYLELFLKGNFNR